MPGPVVRHEVRHDADCVLYLNMQYGGTDRATLYRRRPRPGTP